jgi:hypothetical protein
MTNPDDRAAIDAMARGINETAYAEHEASWATEMWPVFVAQATAALAGLRDAGWSVTKQPIDMLLWCPQCHTQHVDEPDERTEGWSNPLHRSHLCHNCGTIWRPADIPTNGIVAISTRGKADTWAPPAPEPRDV